MSDLDDVESGQLDVDTISRAGIDTPCSPTAFDDLEVGGSARNPILLDKEEYEENSPPTIPVSERPTQPRPFATRIKNNPEYGYRNLFQEILPCMCFKINYL